MTNRRQVKKLFRVTVCCCATVRADISAAHTLSAIVFLQPAAALALRSSGRLAAGSFCAPDALLIWQPNAHSERLSCSFIFQADQGDANTPRRFMSPTANCGQNSSLVERPQSKLGCIQPTAPNNGVKVHHIALDGWLIRAPSASRGSPTGRDSFAHLSPSNESASLSTAWGEHRL